VGEEVEEAAFAYFQALSNTRVKYMQKAASLGFKRQRNHLKEAGVSLSHIPLTVVLPYLIRHKHRKITHIIENRNLPNYRCESLK
jgi:hypothetical protein